MSLKSIRESYSRFLTVLKDAGIKINESQKADLDSFILAVEAKMSKQKEFAVKATKKIVTEHLESKYKKVFESLFKHLQENSELTSKIATKAAKLNESKKISQKVSNYLDLYVESVLPKKTIVDYGKMHKLEKIHESLKNMLLVNDSSVEAKKEELTESFNKDRKALETQIAKLQVKLNESNKKAMALNKKLDDLKAVELLESKTKDLPAFEARQIKKRLAGASAAEVEKKFKKVYESVKNDMADASNEEETSIEEEVKDIIEAEDGVKEDDLLDDRPHNLHAPLRKEAEGDKPTNECGDGEKKPKKDEQLEEQDDIDENDLDEAFHDEISESQMDAWVKRFSTIDC